MRPILFNSNWNIIGRAQIEGKHGLKGGKGHRMDLKATTMDLKATRMDLKATRMDLKALNDRLIAFVKWVKEN
jgi:hypothetical protein